MAVGAMPLFGRYIDAELIGQGRVATVYRARDSLLGRRVALKVLDPRVAVDAVARRQFVRAALAAAALSAKPHVGAVYDVGESDGQAYIVMEYLPGGSLEERLQEEGAQRPATVLDWLDQAAAALDAAHAEGIVHGDVRPANLLLDARDEISVVDFGITPAGTTEARGSSADDRYGLAVVGFELLSGELPIAGDRSISAVDPTLPPALDPVFTRALAPDPAERYASCAELVAALRAAFADAAEPAEPTVVTPPPAEEAAVEGTPTSRYVARRRGASRTLWGIAGVLVLVGLAVGLATSLLRTGHTDARRVPRTSTDHSVTSSTAQPDHRAQTTPQASGTPSSAPSGAAPSPGPAAPAAPVVPAAPAAEDPHRLNDEGYLLMRRGAYQAALPLLEQAVRDLQGQTSDVYDGYANFNLGLDLIKLGRCGDALPYLRTAEQIEPYRPEVAAAIKAARRCSSEAP